METHQTRKTPLLNKLHALIEMYTNAPLSVDEEETLHKTIDKGLTVCTQAQASKNPSAEVEKSKKRKIEAQHSLFSTTKTNKKSSNEKPNMGRVKRYKRRSSKKW